MKKIQAIFLKGLWKQRCPTLRWRKLSNYSEHPEWGTSYWTGACYQSLDAAGEVTGLVFCLLDVTERRLAQDALRQSEALLRKVLDTCPSECGSPIRTGDIDVDPAAEKIWGGGRYVGLDEYGEYKGWWADTENSSLRREWALPGPINRGEVSLK